MSPSSILSLSSLSVALYALAAVAQNTPTVLNLSDSKLPACASSCAALTGANAACVPPAAPVTDQASYQACFCNFASLQAFKSNANAILCQSCAATDLPAIQQYYNSLCAAPAKQSSTTSPTTKTTTKPTTSPSTTNNNNNNGSNTTGTGAQSSPSSADAQNKTANSSGDDDKSWFSGHWQWVLLVIILVIAFIFFLTFGFWLKRRHRRKEEQRLSGVGMLDGGSSPHLSGHLPYVGGTAGNHPQMTVVPGAGSEAAMARYDGSGVGSVGSRSIGSRPQSFVRTSNVGGAASPYADAIAPVGMGRPMAASRLSSDDSRDSRRKKLRTTLRSTVEADDDIIEITDSNVGATRPQRSGSDATRTERLKNKLMKTVGK